MLVEIDGVNIMPYIAYGGLQWQRMEVAGDNDGVMLDGTTERNPKARKVQLSVTCRKLKAAEAARVLSAIAPKWVTVRYGDPMEGITVTRTMYSNNSPATFLVRAPDGTEYWEGISFPLIER